jgi:hypothetical protein
MLRKHEVSRKGSLKARGARGPQRSAVWVAPGSKATDLTFVFGHERSAEAPIALGAISVHPCGTPGGPAEVNAMWFIVSRSGAESMTRLRYGDSRPSFAVLVPPRALTPDCYDAEITGMGRTRLQVEADADVVDRGPAW